VVAVEELLFRGHPEVVDADLADYFGSIPTPELLNRWRAEVSIGACCNLIKMWLEGPVEETDDRGRKTRTTRPRTRGPAFRRAHRFSPLLANRTLRRFVLGWKMLEQSLGSRHRSLRRRSRDPARAAAAFGAE